MFIISQDRIYFSLLWSIHHQNRKYINKQTIYQLHKGIRFQLRLELINILLDDFICSFSPSAWEFYTQVYIIVMRNQMQAHPGFLWTPTLGGGGGGTPTLEGGQEFRKEKQLPANDSRQMLPMHLFPWGINCHIRTNDKELPVFSLTKHVKSKLSL